MTNQIKNPRETRQYLIRFVVFPGMLLITTWILTEKDFRAVLILLVGILVFNSIYWLLRYSVNHAASMKERLDRMGERNPLLYLNEKDDPAKEEMKNSSQQGRSG